MKGKLLLSALALLQGLSSTLGQTIPVTCSGEAGLLTSYFDTINPIEPAVGRNITEYADYDAGTGLMHPGLTSPTSNSVLMSGVFKPLVTGLYTFQVQSDDGSRIYIDGDLVVGLYNVQNYAVGFANSLPIHLEAGHDYLFQYDYFQSNGFSHLTIRYSINNGPFEILDSSVTNDCHFTPSSISNMDCSTTAGGLTGYYYNSQDFSNLAGIRVDFPTQRFEFNLGDNNPFPGVIADVDSFSVIWKGALKVDSSGLYRIYISSQDLVEVYLGNMLIHRNSQTTGFDRVTSAFYLTANEFYLIEFRWIEGGGQQNFSPRLSKIDEVGTQTFLFGTQNFRTCQPNEVVSPIRASLKGKIGTAIPVSLRTQPIGEVIVTVLTNANLGATPCVLKFDSINWDAPKIVYATTNSSSGEVIIFEPSSKFDSNYNSSSAASFTTVFGTQGSCSENFIKGPTCTSWGDPHYITFDGLHYDYHAPSDVTLVQTLNSEFVVQTRQAPCGVGTVSCNYAAAIKYKDAVMRIFISSSTGAPTLQYNTATSIGSGIEITRTGDDTIFNFPNSISVEVRSTWWAKGMTYYLSVYITIPTAYLEKVRGMCGNYDGKMNNEYVLKDGSITSDFAVFAQEWVVSSEGSLIDSMDAIIPPISTQTTPTLPCSYQQCEPEDQPPSCEDCTPRPPPPIPPTPCTLSLSAAQQYCSDIFLTSTYAKECAKIGVNTTTYYDSCVTEVFEMCDKDKASPGACSFQIACSQAPVPQCPCLCNLNGVCVADNVCSCLPDSGGDNCRDDPNSVPCSIQASPSSGLIGDWVYITVAELKPNRSYRCKFGTKVTVNATDAVWIDHNTIKCRAPPRVIAMEVDVIVLVDGVGENCGARFNYTSASGEGDPHFSGFHGEKMEVKKDDLAANQLFHIYCSESITITSLFYEYPDKLLFMTKFWIRLGSTMFTLNLSTQPKVLTPHEPAYFVKGTNRNRIDIPDGHLTWDDKKLRVTYKHLKINFSKEVYLQGSPFMNIDFNLLETTTEKATGIIGRTLHNSLTNEQFETFLQFKAPVNDIIGFQCSLPYDLI